MTNMSTKTQNVNVTIPTWPPRVHIDWLKTGDIGVHPDDTSPAPLNSGDIRVGSDIMSPITGQGLNLNVTKGSL